MVVKKIPNVKCILSIMSGKGGVGKSTTTFQLARELARNQKSVGILDADISGPAIPHMAQIFDKPDIHPETKKILPKAIPWSQTYFAKNGVFMSMGLITPTKTSLIWRTSMVINALKQMLFEVEWGDKEQVLDYLLIDMPSNIGEVHFSLLKLAKPDGVILVATPDELSHLDLSRSIHFLEKNNVKILGFVENMSQYECGHCSHTENVFESNSNWHMDVCDNIPCLGTIPLDARIPTNQRDMPRYYQGLAQKVMSEFD